jgi:putative sigma-54 modulation protein
MKIEYTGRQTEVPAAAKAAVERRLAKLGKVLHGITHVHVVLVSDKHRMIAEVTVRSPHLTLTAVDESDDLALAAGSVTDKLIRQAQRHVGKVRTRKRVGSRRPGGMWSGVLGPEASASEGVAAAPRVIHTRRFLPKPMTIDEAALELGADGEDLVVYRDAATDRVHVLYRRKDGQLGIIEPEA